MDARHASGRYYDEKVLNDRCKGCDGWGHPSDDPTNNWVWNGVSLDE